MAQTSLRSYAKGIYILGFLCLLLLIQNGNAYEFNVGGSGDWSVPLDPNANDYNQWAERSRFQIGDSLLFVYPADKDSVLLVTKEDYANCSTAAPIEKYSDGHSIFKFNQSGPFYFISGVHDNCVKNEKLQVVVMADRSNNNHTVTSPSPSPSTAEVPPAPGPFDGGATSPPSGSVDINPSPTPSQESSPPKNSASSIVMSFVGSVGAFIGSSILLGL
ncbi:PREDICTED: early nodulin-like protein 1 [Nicotiana attenuata]|uniref:Early nodulin-like protein 1 n=1 Tax=Nicotiana attenuata TaxID=49451 RepID=A0A1J6IGH5_NICAT|nr:PREDICTED: early nodulin-like protein 1 [Nicotiana attenuata]OIT03746.1 early nodulin-like protein 1 [Nicotiana attenuata]